MLLRQYGISIKRTTITEMEKIHLDKPLISQFLEHVSKNSQIHAMIILMTCNRAEFYYTCSDQIEAKRYLYNTLASLKKISVKELNTMLIERHDEDAIKHLFSVSSGLESMVYGENEILTQVKEAYQRSVRLKLTDSLLNKVFQTALATGKRVRSETEISRGAYSVSSIGIEAIREKALDYFSRKILVVGAGVMGIRSLKKLEAMGHPNLFISNRSKHKAEKLVSDMNLTLVEYKELKDRIREFDIIIFATSAQHYLVNKKQWRGSTNNTMLIIDLGVPRNVDPELASELDLITVDGLKEIAEKNIKKRKGEKDKILAIISDELEHLHSWKTYKQSYQLIPK